MKTILFLPPAQRALRRHKSDAARLIAKIEAYAADPSAFSNIVSPLKGVKGYRMRVGDFRILFDEDETTVIVSDIGPRGAIYR